MDTSNHTTEWRYVSNLFQFILKKSIGYSREQWPNDDYERANSLLEQQATYIKNVFLNVTFHPDALYYTHSEYTNN